MQIASALSTSPGTAEAAADVAGRVRAGLGEVAVDLAVVFASAGHGLGADELLGVVHDVLAPGALVGCTGESIVGDGREVESSPALSLWAASLPGSRLESFHSTFVRTNEGQGFAGFPDPAERADLEAVLLLADPFTYPAHGLLAYGGQAWPGLRFVGGIASAGSQPGENRLLRDREVHEAGAVGVMLGGDIHVRTVVSQGCRPIGRSYVVTRSEGQLIHELAGRPALERLQDVLQAADPVEQELFRNGPQIGIVIDEVKDTYERGDFLVRGVVGIDPEDGSLAVAEPVEVGRTVRFHVRDAASADEDLREMLASLGGSPSGALLFTCNGRGTRLFDAPDHDVSLIRDALGDIPVAGFFCAGEIGPVGPRSFLHGFTASAAFLG